MRESVPVIVYGAVDPLLVNCPFRLRDASVPKSTNAAVVVSIVIGVGAAIAAIAGVIETGKRGNKLKPKEMTTSRTMRTCDKFIPLYFSLIT